MAAPTLAPGTLLARYRIESFLGAGGMGEVYRASDPSLRRAVALKILPAGLVDEEDRVVRFEREAVAASALNHPAIIGIYEVGSAECVTSSGAAERIHFIAMELVDGTTLDRHAHVNGALHRLLDQMSQVADGLASAHREGIVHRDLKPENIMISRSGFPKILDFGVAKLVEVRSERDQVRAGAPITEPLSLIGTVSYMSPEQLTGEEVDGRSDVFSFGVVLYETLTGRHPFEGSTRVDTMHRIVHEPHASLEEWRKDLGPELGRIVRRCLQKDPNDRYQSMRDLALDLREVVNAEGRRLEEKKAGGTATPRRRLRWAAPLALVALLAAGWIGQRIITRSGSAAIAAERDARDSVSQMEISRLTNSGQTITAAISPDGNYLAHVRADGDKQSLWIKQVASGTYMQVIPPSVAYYSWLTVSDDGNYIYFARADFPEFNVNDVYRVPMLGGEIVRVVRNIEGPLAISPDGSRLAYARFDAEERIRKLFVSQSDGSGERLVLSRSYPEHFTAAVWNPDGKHLHLRLGKDVEERQGLSEEEKKQLDLAVQLDVDSGRITQASADPVQLMGKGVWLPDGSGMIARMFHREQPPQLYLVPEPDGRPRKITNDLNGYHSISVTADSSTIVAVRQEQSSNLWIVDVENPRRPIELTRGQNHYALDGAPRWTPDGNLIVPVYDGRSGLQLLSPEGKLIRTLTDEHNYGLPRISPDGQKLVYITDRGGGQQIWSSNADGSDPRPVVKGRASFPSFLPDGRSIVYSTAGSTQFAWKISLDGGAPVQLTSKPTNMPIVSPDGRWLLCRYRLPEPGKQLWRTAIISMENPGEPHFFDRPRHAGGPRLEWHPDGKHFGYVDWQGGVANVWMQSIEGGEPEQITFFDAGTINAFDWSQDGKRLVVARVEGTSDAVMIRNFR